MAETYLKTGPEDPWSRRIVDCFVSRILEVATIFVWHGIWTCIDILTEEVYGLSHLESSLLSLAVGWTGGLALFLAQFPLLLSSQSHSTYIGLFSSLNFLFNLAGVFITINRYSLIFMVEYFPLFQFPVQLVPFKYLLSPFLS